MIRTECPDGKYGHNCEENCSSNCMIPGKCEGVEGGCEVGCQDGWKNAQCDQGKHLNYLFKIQQRFHFIKP